MNETEIRKLIREEVRSSMDVILSGSAENSTGEAEDIQNLYPGMPGILQRPTAHPYGFCSRAPDGTIQVTAKQGEHIGNRLTLAHRAADRPTDLEDGESTVYSSSTYRLVARQGGLYIGKGSDLEPAVMGKALNTFLNDLVNILIAHTHASPGAPMANLAQLQQLQTQTLGSNSLLLEDGGAT